MEYLKPPLFSILSEKASQALGAMVPFPPRLGRPQEYATLKILDEISSKELKTMQLLEEENFERIKRSILSKAFKGELGTNTS
jgi:hypothetical protein